MNRALGFLPLLIALGACEAAPDERHFMPQSDPERGKAVVERVGCASCHAIPGIDWPRGRVGPPLRGFAEQTLIAGRVPNRADNLTRYVRNAPAVVPGTGMPPMPLSEEESRDVAAFLYTLGS